ncbi:unnamed protein product [Lota lota]
MFRGRPQKVQPLPLLPKHHTHTHTHTQQAEPHIASYANLRLPKQTKPESLTPLSQGMHLFFFFSTALSCTPVHPPHPTPPNPLGVCDLSCGLVARAPPHNPLLP